MQKINDHITKKQEWNSGPNWSMYINYKSREHKPW